MATFTMAQSGPINDTATFNEAGTPGPTDDITVDTFTLTYNDSREIGSAAAADHIAISLVNNGKVVFPADVTPTINGRIHLGSDFIANEVLTINEGVEINFNTANAPTPSAALYGITHNLPLLQGAGHIRISGTALNPCRIYKSGDGTAIIGPTEVSYYVGFMRATYCSFEDLGSASQYAMYVHYAAAAAEPEFTLNNCDFIRCGELWIRSQAAEGNQICEIQNCRFLDSVGTYSLDDRGTRPASFTTGRANISGNTFSKGVNMYMPLNVTIEDNVFGSNGPVNLDIGGGEWASFQNNTIRGGNFIPTSTVSNCFYIDNGPNTKVNFAPVAERGITIEDCILQHVFSTSSVGEFVSGGAGTPLVVRRCIGLPIDGDPTAAGVPGFMVELYPTLYDVTIDHCTWFGEMLHYGHGPDNPTEPGSVKGLKNSIVWTEQPDPGAGSIAFDGAIHSPNVINDHTLMDYNCYWRLGGTTLADRYIDVEITSGDPGANDINANPQFVDSTRNLLSWGESLGLVNPTADDVVTEMLNKTAGFTTQALLAYVREGFAPRNAALRDAGDDGVTIGALEGAFGLITTVTATNTAGSDQEQFTWTEVPPP